MAKGIECCLSLYESLSPDWRKSSQWHSPEIEYWKSHNIYARLWDTECLRIILFSKVFSVYCLLLGSQAWPKCKGVLTGSWIHMVVPLTSPHNSQDGQGSNLHVTIDSRDNNSVYFLRTNSPKGIPENKIISQLLP